ncbi:hypothetical protein [Pontibacter sp. G13]|uniref:hypothetical protein n=1 Tax=Pontibacter sp. G13 TaxID=3074898 RepID=UPI0028894B82|nr:hypothetical protein [Pontibacter sp. G13]WNJ16873.1 hypothetical protein RJD25_18570 [Pontibacter sp. G13]
MSHLNIIDFTGKRIQVDYAGDSDLKFLDISEFQQILRDNLSKEDLLKEVFIKQQSHSPEALLGDELEPLLKTIFADSIKMRKHILSGIKRLRNHLAMVHELDTQDATAQKTLSFFGWMVEELFRKTLTPQARHDPLMNLACMCETFQNSLRYMTIIQVMFYLTEELSQAKQLAQESGDKASYHSYRIPNPLLSEYLFMPEQSESTFDYFGFLSKILDGNKQKWGDAPFNSSLTQQLRAYTWKAPEKVKRIKHLAETRTRLIDGNISEEEASDSVFVYFSKLIDWLQDFSFIATNRMISVKDILTHFQLNKSKIYEHYVADLHGKYEWSPVGPQAQGHFRSFIRSGNHLFSKSVLLLDHPAVRIAYKDTPKALSLSPLIFDHSVHFREPNQPSRAHTPNIFYFSGYQPDSDTEMERFVFRPYTAELPISQKADALGTQSIYVDNQEDFDDDEEAQSPSLKEFYKDLKDLIQIHNPYTNSHG